MKSFKKKYFQKPVNTVQENNFNYLNLNQKWFIHVHMWNFNTSTTKHEFQLYNHIIWFCNITENCIIVGATIEKSTLNVQLLGPYKWWNLMIFF